ncbi:MAG TPA: S41 family peptidase [Oscillospiraceae bacterium]|nr:S41 family peptidase [Oscillospiraceae bacterium]
MKRRIVLLLVLLLVVTNSLTYFGTRDHYQQETAGEPPADNSRDLAEIEVELQPLVEVLDILSERFLEDVSREELINEAINGMVNSLEDPQTNFLDPTNYEEMMIKIDGSFSGIGIEISEVDGYITVVSPIKNTPGEQAGLQPGDRIVAIDGEDAVGISTTDAVKLMRGQEGTTVNLKVERENLTEPLEFVITRANIVVPSVFTELLSDKIGYIQITTFDEHTGRDFQEAMLALETQGMRGLLLDLRNNPGGLLDQAVLVGQEILPAGPITHMVDREGTVLQTYQSYGTKKTYPIVALVNGASASASEIIAGALQDTAAGTLVGTKTYGKATVQHLESLSNQAGLRYTVAKYQTPKGRDIHGNGLVPDVIVELSDDYYLLQYGMIGDLALSDEGTNVLFLQKMLAALNYAVQETSKFDGETEKAVRSFQSKYGLEVNGKVNQATREKLNEQLEPRLEELDVQKKKALEILTKAMQ